MGKNLIKFVPSKMEVLGMPPLILTITIDTES